MNLRLGPKKSRAALSGMCATIVAACGGAPPPAPVVAAPTPPAPPVVQIAAPDMSEVGEPSHMVGVVRWKSPKVTLDTVYQWVGVPLKPSDLSSDATEKKFIESMAIDAPVDLVIALDQKAREKEPLMALSFGVRSVEETRKLAQSAGTVTELGPGEYRIAPHKKKGDKVYCVLHDAVGAAPGRIVCGRHQADVDVLLPYMVRTLPKRDLGAADVHVELRMPPVLDVYGPMMSQGLHFGAAYAQRQLAIGEPTFDRAMGRIATAVSEELGTVAADLDTMIFDVGLQKERATVDVAMNLRAQQSWTAGTIASEGERKGGAPNLFWRLPASAATATFARGADSHRFDAMRRTLAELVDGWLLHEGVSPADRSPINALFGDKYAFDTPVVSATGPFLEAAGGGETKAKPKPNADPLAQALEGAGYYLVGVGTPNQFPDLVKNGVAAFNRGKIQVYFKDRLALLTHGADGKEAPPSITVKSAPTPAGLRAGSAAYEVAITREHTDAAAPDSHAKPKVSRQTVKLQLLVTADTVATWMAFGADRAKLVTVLKAVSDGAPESGTLASRPELAPLRDGQHVEGGYLTLDGAFRLSTLAETFADESAPGHHAGGLDAHLGTLLESSPNKGKSPIFLTSGVTRDSALHVVTHVDVPKGVIEDMLILGATAVLAK